MGLDAQELALFTIADLDVYGVMPEALSDIDEAKKTARIAAAIDCVLSWIPNCKRPVSSVGQYLKEVIGLVASERLMRYDRGVSGDDLAILDGLRADVEKQRELILTAGNSRGIRLVFSDASPGVDDFAPLGATSERADDWAEP